MDKLWHVGVTSTSEAIIGQTIHADNLAKTSVPGFKATLIIERARPMYGEGLPSRVFVAAESPGYDFSPGNMQYTDEPLDIAIANAGLFAVRGNDGVEGYTRRGDLHIDNGLLVNGDGDIVLGIKGPINIPPAQSIDIGEDGAVNIVPLENKDVTVCVGKIKLVNPDIKELIKREDGLFANKNNDVLPASLEVKIKPRTLEASNVSAIGEMMAMMDLARAYELSIKLMENAQENDRASAQLLQLKSS